MFIQCILFGRINDLNNEKSWLTFLIELFIEIIVDVHAV